MLDAADEARSEPLQRSGRLDHGEAPQQPIEEHAELEAGEVRAETEMRTRTEGEMRIRLTIDDEVEGVGENLLIAVGGRIEEAQRLAAADWPSGDFVVLGRRAAELHDRDRKSVV